MIDKKSIFNLREQGNTVETIGKLLGCSKQYVSLVLKQKDKIKIHKWDEQSCIYCGLRKWLNENQIKANTLINILGKNPSGTTYTVVYNKLNGKSDFSLTEIMNLISITNLSFEELFILE